MLVDTSIRLTDVAPAWGLVQVVNHDTTIDREYIVSGSVVADINSGRRECPPGCPLELWRTGRVYLFGKPLEPGLALIHKVTRDLMVNFGVLRVGNRIKTNVMIVPAHQWERLPNDAIRLDSKLAPLLDVGYQKVIADVDD